MSENTNSEDRCEKSHPVPGISRRILATAFKLVEAQKKDAGPIDVFQNSLFKFRWSLGGKSPKAFAEQVGSRWGRGQILVMYTFAKGTFCAIWLGRNIRKACDVMRYSPQNMHFFSVTQGLGKISGPKKTNSNFKGFLGSLDWFPSDWPYIEHNISAVVLHWWTTTIWGSHSQCIWSEYAVLCESHSCPLVHLTSDMYSIVFCYILIELQVYTTLTSFI